MAFAIRAAIFFAGLVKQLVKQGFVLGIDRRVFAAKAAGGIDNDALILPRAGRQCIFNRDMICLRRCGRRRWSGVPVFHKRHGPA